LALLNGPVIDARDQIRPGIAVGCVERNARV
jgi:hypothetical protein